MNYSVLLCLSNEMLSRLFAPPLGGACLAFLSSKHDFFFFSMCVSTVLLFLTTALILFVLGKEVRSDDVLNSR